MNLNRRPNRNRFHKGGTQMSVLKLFRILPLSLLLTSQAVFLPVQAFGWTCCDCWSCTWTPGCVCPGTPGYCPGYACRSNDTDRWQANASTGNGTVDIRAPRMPGEAERLVGLTRIGECARRSFAARVLGDAGESLKV